MTQGKHFAHRLIRLREQAGLSKYELARRAGLTRQSLSLLELGLREPAWLTVQVLALALGVSCEQFIDPGVKLPELKPPRPAGRPRKVQADGETPKQTRKGR
jgi:transcriptional regulator with XRE-family HTH domain